MRKSYFLILNLNKSEGVCYLTRYEIIKGLFYLKIRITTFNVRTLAARL